MICQAREQEQPSNSKHVTNLKQQASRFRKFLNPFFWERSKEQQLVTNQRWGFDSVRHYRIQLESD